MRKIVPLLIGLRYTRAKRRNQFISFVSGFSLLGMALGVMALIIVLSVMNGLDREMKQRILRVVPHGFVDADRPLADWQSLARQVEAQPRVLAAAPYVAGSGVATRGRQSEWTRLQGVLPEAEQQVSDIAGNMLLGDLDDLRPGQWGIVLGRTLARFVGVSSLGDQVTLTTPQFSSTLIGPSPRTRRFTVVGIFEVGAQVDSGLAMIHMDDAAKLFRTRGPEGLHVKVDDIYQAADIMQTVRQAIGDDYRVRDWSQTQGSLFQAVRMEKILVMIMLMIIVAIAAFNIITSLVLMVADKRSDIAVLRTLGMNARQVMGIFVVQGSAVGLVGIIAGALLGALGAVYLTDIVTFFESLSGRTVFDPDVYYIPSLPSHLQWGDVMIVCGIAVVLSVLATLYPAFRASRIEPAEALRYE